MIKDISDAMSKKYYYNDMRYSRGEALEDLLTDICDDLGSVAYLTEGKADVEFVLGVVGSYLVAKNSGKLPEDAKPPSYIFNENLFPAIDNMDEVIVEEILEDDD